MCPKKSLLSPRSHLFLSAFLSRHFTVFIAVIVRGMIHSNSLFIQCKVTRVELHCFPSGCPIIQAPFVVKTILSLLNYFGSFVEIQLTIYWGCIFPLFTLFHWSIMSVFTPITQWLDSYSFIVSSNSGTAIPPKPNFLSILNFHINFSISLPI